MRSISIILGALLITYCSHDREAITVGIQPYNDINVQLVDTIAKAISSTYDSRTVILPSVPIPDETFVNLKTPRYRADKIISLLKEQKPDSLHHMLAVTAHDISFTKKDRDGNIKKPESKYADWGIFGLGYRPGPTCVVSTYRIKTNDENIFRARIKKIAIHELGHNLGLPHCDTESCVMRDAVETIKTIDAVGLQLCPACRKKIGLPDRVLTGASDQ